MDGNDLKKGKILALSESRKFGFYRVTREGQFLECDQTAREIFGIPQEETDLSSHSIKDLYVVPVERGRRIRKLEARQSEILIGNLLLRVGGEDVLLFDACWCETYQDQESFVGIVAKIEDITLLPRMFDTFPMGLFEIDDDRNVVRINRKALEILKYEDESEILNRCYKDFCEDQDVLENFIREIEENGFAYDILRLRNAEDEIIEVECFSQAINETDRARWGMINDITKRERYFRAFENMPTGYFYIENECIKDCNERFVRLQGFENKEAAIGVHTKELFADEEEREKYLQNLREADGRGEPLQNYEFRAKRVDNGEIIHVSVDVHMVKSGDGNEIGREGTARDLTEEVTLRNQVKEAEERMKKTTDDINNFVHTFLHPVVQFAGDAELLYQVGNALYQSVKQGMPPTPGKKEGAKELGEKLMSKLIDIRDIIHDSGEDISYAAAKNNPLKSEIRKFFTMGDLREKLTQIINTLDYSLQEEESEILLEADVRTTALMVLEDLNKLGGLDNDKLKPFIKRNFIEFLQDILFNYLTQSARALVGETESMKRHAETLRDHMGVKDEKKKKKYIFLKHDIGKILEKILEHLRPAFWEKNIEIEYKKGEGNFNVEISQNDFEKVITNILLNARKYSYPGKRRFVKVLAKELGFANQVELSIESFGVPIKEEEIENEAIWKFGYRGELAYRHDRDGTGVGLADAKEVIEAHGGEILMTSRPAIDDGSPPRYNVPYITTVTIRLPKSGSGHQKGVTNG